VFKFTPAGQFTNLYNFAGPIPAGTNPSGGMTLGGNGNFYGTTRSGGQNNGGIAYNITPGGIFSKLTDLALRSNTVGGLVLGTDGNFYGTTARGSDPDPNGTVSKMTPAGTLTTIIEFTGEQGIAKGSKPACQLLQASDGNIYATLNQGGSGGAGTVFRVRFGPTPVTQPAAPVGSKTATLRGAVNPNGNATVVSFLSSTDPNLSGAISISAGNLAAGTTAQPVSADVSRLKKGQKWYYRVVAQNAENNIPQKGAIQSFTTTWP
jgi:uncharacterized repeat protein (TIGR03803 family)